jgi:hypothetical protein
MSELNQPQEGAGAIQALTEPDRTVVNNKRYAGSVKKVIREWNRMHADVRDGNEKGNGRKVLVADAFRSFAIAKGQQGISNEALFTDGLHWSAKGYGVRNIQSNACTMNSADDRACLH